MIRNLAIVGATGAVGQIVLEEIQQQGLKYGNIKLLASARSAGKKVDFAGKSITVELLEPSAFDGVDVVIASTPDEVAAEFVPWAVERGARLSLMKARTSAWTLRCLWSSLKSIHMISRSTKVSSLVPIAARHKWSWPSSR